jgi:hypothetical protein
MFQIISMFDWRHLAWMLVGATVLKVFQWWWGWLERAFVLGFKAIMLEQGRLGRRLTKEEGEAIKTKCKARLVKDMEAEEKALRLDE